MWVTIRASQEEMGAAMNMIQSAQAEFEDTISKQVEGICQLEDAEPSQGAQQRDTRDKDAGRSLHGGSGNTPTCMDRVREPKGPWSLGIECHRTG
jgi:hypothetical protein